MRARIPLVVPVALALVFVVAPASAHPGGVDDNGGHVDRSTGQYHCHRSGCVLPGTTPVAPVTPSRAISAASFNIQFLGNGKRRDNDALAEIVEANDIVVVQELVAPPFPGTFPDGSPFKSDPEAAAFFDAMTSRGFDFVLSPEDTGTGNTIHNNGTATEWWVVFFRPAAVEPVTDLPGGFLADDRSNHPDYERVPYAFPFRSSDGALDFVLISVHLEPGAGTAETARRAHELATIAQWVDAHDDTEKDFLVLGDMNIEDCDELADATPSGFQSLNDMCVQTNTNVNGPKPYDHVLYRPSDTTGSELTRAFGVLDLVALMAPSWPLRHQGPYPGNPYKHNDFRAVYSDHSPVTFELTSPNADDD